MKRRRELSGRPSRDKSGSMNWWSRQFADFRMPLARRKNKLRGIDDLKSAQAPFLIDSGRDDSGLIIAFTGFIDRLSLRVYEFFEATRPLGYHRILLRDQNRLWYHHGIDRKRRNWDQLLEFLATEIATINPRKVMCLGTSAGGYAALIAGHQLAADYVHAFGPDTLLETSASKIWHSRYRLAHLKLRLSRRVKTEFLDLAGLLKDPNRKTSYFVHYCVGCRSDRQSAERIERLPGVQTLGYPCTTHQAAMFVAKKGFLAKILNFDHQDGLTRLAQEHFGDQLRIGNLTPQSR